jgi:diaminopimelate decarboxylase
MLLGTQRVNSAGHLEIGGCDVMELAEKYGTPLYIIDEETIREKCRSYRRAFETRYPKNIICFAGKSFLTRAMCRIIDQEGLFLDVASAGELYTAIKADFPANRINLHGNNKSKQELMMALEAGIAHVILDNFQEIETLATMAKTAGKTIDVLVRCAPGVDPHTHKFISTGQADTKFGFNIKDGSAMKAIRQVLSCDALHFDGIHCHVGSQLLDTEAHEGAVDAMVSLMREILDDTGVVCSVLNIGGGLGVRYLEEHCPPSIDDFAEVITCRLMHALTSAGLPIPTLQQEPGRAIVGEAGTTLYRVGSVKRVPIKEEPGERTYVSVDGGMSDNPRPQLYDAVYELIVANKAKEPHDTLITLAGKHCETDVLIWDTLAACPQPGDVIAVQTTGAYNYAMASNYNKALRPPVLLLNEGRADVIVERETLDDLLIHDCIPDRLKG